MAGAASHTGSATNRWRIAAWAGAAGLLAAPLVAMRFTDEVAWTGSDFLVGALLVGGLGIGFELAVRAARGGAYRIAAMGTLGTAFFLIWSTLAVGLIGSEDNPANLMYGGVLAIPLIGGLLVRFRARGMASMLAATAAAQLGVAAIGLASPFASSEIVQLADVALVSAFFAALWLACAALFLRAARDN